MNKVKHILKFSLFILLYYLLFKYNNIINYSVIYSVSLWITKVFPSLFISFIINDIIIYTGLISSITKQFNRFFNKLFRMTGNSFEAFFLSLFSGAPTSSYILKEMLHNNQINVNSANKLICFNFFSNPLFLYNILLISFNKKTTIKIILILYISNIIVGLLLKNSNNAETILITNKKKEQDIFPKTIINSFNQTLSILGIITFYSIITNIIFSIINLSLNTNILLKGLIEMTQGLSKINLIHNTILKEIIAITIISFGGISIHTQVYNIIKDTEIHYINFLKGRILQLLISITTTIFFISISI